LLALGALGSWHWENFISIANVIAINYDSLCGYFLVQYIVKSIFTQYFEKVFGSYPKVIYLFNNNKLPVLYEKND
jgi:hypothetical protein